jgi:hypothetical protein
MTEDLVGRLICEAEKGAEGMVEPYGGELALVEAQLLHILGVLGPRQVPAVQLKPKGTPA